MLTAKKKKKKSKKKKRVVAHQGTVCFNINLYIYNFKHNLSILSIYLPFQIGGHYILCLQSWFTLVALNDL